MARTAAGLSATIAAAFCGIAWVFLAYAWVYGLYHDTARQETGCVTGQPVLATAQLLVALAGALALVVAGQAVRDPGGHRPRRARNAFGFACVAAVVWLLMVVMLINGGTSLPLPCDG